MYSPLLRQRQGQQQLLLEDAEVLLVLTTLSVQDSASECLAAARQWHWLPRFCCRGWRQPTTDAPDLARRKLER
jgi:hypothetical protein